MRALQFSGGLDSLALLFWLREEWTDLHVFWLNTGAAYPETLAYMERIKQFGPLNFHEVQGNQPQSIAEFGWPADVVPVHATRIGHAVHGTTGLMFQSYLDCCSRSMWQPMHEAMVAHGVTDVYRGQRNADARRAPVRNGHVEGGITYHFPLEHWSRDDVLSYCRAECPDLIPDYYAAGERVSRDCWNCTAYLDDNIERINALPSEQRIAVVEVVDELRAQVARLLEV